MNDTSVKVATAATDAMPPIRPQNAPPAVARRMPTARTNTPSSEP